MTIKTKTKLIDLIMQINAVSTDTEVQSVLSITQVFTKNINLDIGE